MAIRQKTFTSADLTLDGGQYKLVYTHNLNTAVYIPSVYDNNGRLLGHNTEYQFAKGNLTADNKPNVCTVSFSDDIPGTYELYLEYGAAESTSGRKAFELGEADPSDDYRVILGKADTPSINMTLTGLYAKLLAKLGFLKVAQNLADLADKAVARTNLGVYSTIDVDNGLATKATLYQAASGAVLGVDNTAVYNPSSQYNPATKGYVDSNILSKGIGGAWTETAVDYNITTPIRLLVKHTTGTPKKVYLETSVPDGSIVVIMRGGSGGVDIYTGSGAFMQWVNDTNPMNGQRDLTAMGQSVVFLKNGNTFYMIANNS